MGGWVGREGPAPGTAWHAWAGRLALVPALTWFHHLLVALVRIWLALRHLRQALVQCCGDALPLLVPKHPCGVPDVAPERHHLLHRPDQLVIVHSERGEMPDIAHWLSGNHHLVGGRSHLQQSPGLGPHRRRRAAFRPSPNDMAVCKARACSCRLPMVATGRCRRAPSQRCPPLPVPAQSCKTAPCRGPPALRLGLEQLPLVRKQMCAWMPVTPNADDLQLTTRSWGS